MEFQEVLDFWFGDDAYSPAGVGKANKRWFGGGAEFDSEIRRRFGKLPEQALAGELNLWRDNPKSSLALILVLDQFPRNLFRGSPDAFAFDEMAVDVAVTSLERDFHSRLHPVERLFLYLPFEHAENVALQRRCVSLCLELKQEVDHQWQDVFHGYLEYAQAHLEVIERFGRFPHRNTVLGREPTRQETEYLEGGGRTF